MAATELPKWSPFASAGPPLVLSASLTVLMMVPGSPAASASGALLPSSRPAARLNAASRRAKTEAWRFWI